MSPYKFAFRKICHLLVELEHRVYWAVKLFNFDLVKASDKKKVDLSELDEICNDAYESYKVFDARIKDFHDKWIVKKAFEPGQNVWIYDLNCIYFLVN